ncbi:MAG: polyphosphate kinase 2 family protein, partial [Pseudomonadota bacterium]
MGDYPSMKSIVDATRVRPGASPHPDDLPTHGEFLFPGKTHARDCLESDAIAINELQDTLYGEGKRALLV